jgi:hypothetical protein
MIRPGLQLARVAGRRMASTAAAAGENEFIANRKAMRDHAVRAFVISRVLDASPLCRLIFTRRIAGRLSVGNY